MSNEPLERITQLENQVRRWRRISVVLALLLILVVAVGGIFTAIPATQERGDFWHWLPWVRARHAREEARDLMRAKLAEEAAMEAADAERRAANEREQRAEDAAAKKEP